MKLGIYETKRVIGKGGMGEVFVVYDPVCEREVALKRIRSDLKNRDALKKRFLREAKITASLTHPGIISIYAIYDEQDEVYYTMPYVEGSTLRKLLTAKSPQPIASLLPIFKTICQTIAYVHSKGIIHRDLKPENILVGNFGEVIILDWGLAQPINASTEEDVELIPGVEGLTQVGKIVGTLAYMAPERILGERASVTSDIYSLGAILYQMLTLHLPYERGSVKHFKKNHPYENLIDPQERAPYRDVPPSLVRIVRKALSPNKSERYQKVEEILDDLLNYMEGRFKWFESTRLEITNKEDWEFQENVLIAKHIAITRTTEATEWVSLMISQASFAQNLKLETQVKISKGGSGIGFLLNVPESGERNHPLSGYYFWMGTQEDASSQFFRNTHQVVLIPDLYLKQDVWHTLLIEKVDNHLNVSLDGIARFKYVSYLPMMGTRVGVVAKDAAFEIQPIIVSLASYQLQISCLAIPDVFLANKDYQKALAEYRRIGYSFPGHTEGREALFRAGITLLEEAKNAKNQKEAMLFYTAALDEFTKLHSTPGAPLEYLGKSLAYKSLQEHDEEIKCLDLGLRRYQQHPLVNSIKEEIIYRMHESSQTDRISAYKFVLIVLRQMQETAQSSDCLRLFRHLISHEEPLYFFTSTLDPSTFGKEEDQMSRTLHQLQFATHLAFWLANTYVLQEIFHDLQALKPLDEEAQSDVAYALVEIGSYLAAQKLVGTSDPFLQTLFIYFEQDLEAATKHFFSLPWEDLDTKQWRTLCFLIERALLDQKYSYVEKVAASILPLALSFEDRLTLDTGRLYAFLMLDDVDNAALIFDQYPAELLNQDTTALHPLFGCFLYITEGEEIAKIHFAGVLDTTFPHSAALLGHEVTNGLLDNPKWFKTSFMWERRQLYKQLVLYYHCKRENKKEDYYRLKEKEEYFRQI